VHSNKEGKIRIIAGVHRGRKIPVPARSGVRPTPDRVRETLFNWLGQRLDGLACLDLFAGSGALGFEAVSRGAARVVMVESDREVFAVLEKSREILNASAVHLVRGDALAYLAQTGERFDVVFLDPPFRQNALAPVMERLAPRLAPRARVYLEAESPLAASPSWLELKRERAGQVSYQLLQYEGVSE
jgi:16S rRNA (guanine966-N2)-methyltransferase